MNPTLDNNIDSSHPEDEQQPPLHSFMVIVMDVAGPNFSQLDENKPPSETTKKLFDMLDVANQELWSGCPNCS